MVEGRVFFRAFVVFGGAGGRSLPFAGGAPWWEGACFFVLLSYLAERAKKPPAGHGRCANAHRRTLATTNAELGTATSSAITLSPTARRARKVRHAHRRTLATTNAELRTPKAPQAQAHVEKNGGET